MKKTIAIAFTVSHLLIINGYYKLYSHCYVINLLLTLMFYEVLFCIIYK